MKIILRRPLTGVAESSWNQWPDGRGMGGRMRVESVAGWPWNGWPDARGISGRMTVEYAEYLRSTRFYRFIIFVLFEFQMKAY